MHSMPYRVEGMSCMKRAQDVTNISVPGVTSVSGSLDCGLSIYDVLLNIDSFTRCHS
jgi:hypothetical protein